MLTFIDLFAGLGGFRYGFEKAGLKCVGFCEWDKFATMSYTSMHLVNDEQRDKLSKMTKSQIQKEIQKEDYKNGEWYSSDIRNITGKTIPKCDIWCFGAPCQDFSLSGHRAGLDGDRSSLIREVFRILGEIEEKNRPRWIIYENVKGMHSSNNGFDYLEILLSMEKLGYDIEWQNFNSKNYGVPQNRERIYTIGHLRRYGGEKVLPLKGIDRFTVEKELNLWTQSKTDNSENISIKCNRKDGITELNSSNSHCLMARDGCGIGNQSMSAVLLIKEGTARGYKEAVNGDSINLSYLKSETRRGRVGNGIANTLLCNGTQGVIAVDEDALCIRKLTPREYFRLQGWPDEYFDRAKVSKFRYATI